MAGPLDIILDELGRAFPGVGRETFKARLTSSDAFLKAVNARVPGAVDALIASTGVPPEGATTSGGFSELDIDVADLTQFAQGSTRTYNMAGNGLYYRVEGSNPSVLLGCKLLGGNGEVVRLYPGSRISAPFKGFTLTVLRATFGLAVLPARPTPFGKPGGSAIRLLVLQNPGIQFDEPPSIAAGFGPIDIAPAGAVAGTMTLEAVGSALGPWRVAGFKVARVLVTSDAGTTYDICPYTWDSLPDSVFTGSGSKDPVYVHGNVPRAQTANTLTGVPTLDGATQRCFDFDVSDSTWFGFAVGNLDPGGAFATFTYSVQGVA